MKNFVKNHILYKCKNKADTDRSQKICQTAFTLAEVLITLGVIGIVASMTLPSLIQKQQEKARVVALKKFYSVISQAYEFAVLEHGEPDVWGFSFNDSELLLSNLKSQMKFIKFCKNGDKCHPAAKIAYRNGNRINNNIFNPSNNTRYAAVLADGMIIGTWVQSPDCKASYGPGKHLSNVCGEYMIDINGAKNPNRYGDDIFIFNITKYGIVPVGAQIFDNVYEQNEDENTRFNTKNYRFDTGCLDKNAYGFGCAGWVLQNENMDYLHCTNLSWNGNNKCK